jgi:dTDP-4-amino-4,6-dideoxygalactose transaminase
MTRIPIAKPLFGEEELAAVVEPLKSGWVVQGPKVAEFERLFSTYTGAPHSVAASNCTTALHMAVAALGLKPGDEVIVPAFTWVSTANVVEYMGAKPVFCDIDLATYNIDVRKIEPLLSSRCSRSERSVCCRCISSASAPTWTRCSSLPGRIASGWWKTPPAPSAPGTAHGTQGR